MLHLTLGLWLTGCSAAAWWQISRAGDGNALSYMYAIEWPVFGLLGIAGWWALLHVEEVSDEEKSARRDFEENMRREAHLTRHGASTADPSMAAYNDHLAQLSQRPKKKLWGH
jgi:DNA-binding transcriptional regulator of glucitol operon